MKSKLATVVTGAMLILATNSLPSHGLNTSEASAINTDNQVVKNEEASINQKSWKRYRHKRRKTVCRVKRVYSKQKKRWVRIRECRHARRRVSLRYY